MRCLRNRRNCLCFALSCLVLTSTSVPPLLAQHRPVEWPQPADVGLLAMDIRGLAQWATLPQFDVFYDFQFDDLRERSGIRFKHEVTEDGGKTFKAVHYDHGTSILVGDVDGDDLLDLYFVSQMGRSELWRNLGGGRFEDITDAAGVALETTVRTTAAFADIDNDGDQDLYSTSVRTGNNLLLNDGTGKFTDVTEGSGLEHIGHSSAGVFFDYDNDGLLDLFLTNVGVYTHDEKGTGGYYLGRQDAFLGHNYPERTEASILYRNLGGAKFRDVSQETGLVETGWNGDGTFTDLDGDLFPDLYVVNMQGDDTYWENQGGKRFVEKIQERFPKNPWGAMGIKFFDWNNDELMDLMLTDMHSDMSREIMPGWEKHKSFMVWTEEDYLTDGAANNIFGNAFWENQGEGRFQEISDEINAENYWPWGISVGDLNADGWEDVFIASGMSYPYRYGINTVLLNNEGRTFLDSEFILGVEPRKGNHIKKPEFNLDCFAEDKDHHLCRNPAMAAQLMADMIGGMTGQLLIMGSVGTRSSVIMDLEGDGDLDVVTNEQNDVPMILVSNLSDKKKINYLRIKLTGSQANRDGLGTLVKVYAGDRVFTKYHDGKSGYLSQSSGQPLYFGLGDATSVDRIDLVWQSGTRQTIRQDIALNTTIEVVEQP